MLRWFALSLAVLLAGPARSSETIVCDGSTTVGPIAKAFAEFYMKQNPDVSITVSESGSGNGAKSLLNGTCQVACMSRFMTESEFKAAVDRGTLPIAHTVAFDGIAVVVNPRNPVGDLSLDQLRRIYNGEITSWSGVGGPDIRIVAISRDTNSGTYETFESLVLRGDKISGSAEYVGSNGAIRGRVQNTPAAIGYVGLGFVDRTVKPLLVDGVEPSPETIASGKYPIARPLFMFTDGYPDMGSHLFGFINLYLAPKGQEIVEGIGFVPVTRY